MRYRMRWADPLVRRIIGKRSCGRDVLCAEKRSGPRIWFYVWICLLTSVVIGWHTHHVQLADAYIV